MPRLKPLVFCLSLFLTVGTFSQDCNSKVSVDKFTKEKKAVFQFDRKDYDKKKSVTLSIKTLSDKLDCFLMDFWIDTYTGKPGILGTEDKKPDLFGKSFTFIFCSTIIKA